MTGHPTDPIQRLIAEWREPNASAMAIVNSLRRACADALEAVTKDTVTLPREDVGRLVRAAREILIDECAGVNVGCASTDALDAALALPSIATLGEPTREETK